MYNLIQTIKRFFYWGWTLRKSYDWDYGYVEEMLYLKIKRLKHTMDTDKHHMNLDDLRKSLKELDPNHFNYEFELSHTKETIRCYKALNIVVAILERRQQNDFYEDLSGFNAFFEKYTNGNKCRFLSEEHKEVLPKEEYRPKFLALFEASERLKARDKEILYKLIAKYSDGWWT